MISRNVIICSFAWQYRLAYKYPKRKIEPCAYCAQDTFYYFNKKTGSVRQVELKNNTIWECDYERGFPYMRRIR